MTISLLGVLCALAGVNLPLGWLKAAEAFAQAGKTFNDTNTKDAGCSIRAPAGEAQLGAAHDFIEGNRERRDHGDQPKQLGGIEALGEPAGEITDARRGDVQLR